MTSNLHGTKLNWSFLRGSLLLTSHCLWKNFPFGFWNNPLLAHWDDSFLVSSVSLSSSTQALDTEVQYLVLVLCSSHCMISSEATWSPSIISPPFHLDTESSPVILYHSHVSKTLQTPRIRNLSSRPGPSPPCLSSWHDYPLRLLCPLRDLHFCPGFTISTAYSSPRAVIFP